MIPTSQQREDRYQALTSESVRELYAGEAAGAALRKTFQDFHLPEEIYREYALAFGDVVLGLEDEARMPRVLEERLGLSEKLSTVIAHDLLEFINTHKMSAKSVPPQVAPAAPFTPSPSEVPAPIPTKAEPSATPTPLAAPIKEEPPTWSRRVVPPEAQPGSAPLPNTPQAPATPSSIPQYAKPYTDVPRYIPDPYREPPK